VSFAFKSFSGPGSDRPSHHEGKEGEQHAEDLGLMDALRGGARAHLLNDLNAKMAGC